MRFALCAVRACSEVRWKKVDPGRCSSELSTGTRKPNLTSCWWLCCARRRHNTAKHARVNAQTWQYALWQGTRCRTCRAAAPATRLCGEVGREEEREDPAPKVARCVNWVRPLRQPGGAHPTHRRRRRRREERRAAARPRHVPRVSGAHRRRRRRRRRRGRRRVGSGGLCGATQPAAQSAWRLAAAAAHGRHRGRSLRG
jgi:hypothetical protein